MTPKTESIEIIIANAEVARACDPELKIVYTLSNMEEFWAAKLS